jgi:hypothetical protein
MPVNTNHPDYTEFEPIWKRTTVVSKGTHWVKKEKDLLPAEFADEFPERYARYKERAYVQGVTGRTRDSLVGMVFRRPPTVNVPAQMEPWLENIDGAGQSLEQVAKAMMKRLLETGRYALLVDAPQMPENASAEEEQAMDLRPTLAAYPAPNLINWRFEGVKGKQKLTMAVLVELIDKRADEFGHDKDVVYRVLRLRDGVYTQQLYNIDASARSEEWTPRTAGRQTLDYIPLQIVGAENNLPDVDMPPLYNLAEIEIAQYRNIADLEEAGFVIAQPMLHIDIGDTDAKTWNEQNPNGVSFGSRHGITTVKGRAEIMQAQSDNLSMTLVDSKTAQMAQMGASLVQRGGQTETAEAARINASAEASVLETVVGNASEGIEASLETMARFAGIEPGTIEYQLNSSFWESGLDPQALTAIMAARQGNALATRDVIHMIKTGRIELEEDRTPEDIAADVANEMFDEPFSSAGLNQDGQ